MTPPRNPAPNNLQDCHNVGRYKIVRFTAAENPFGAVCAQQIQGESYVHAGYIPSLALDPDGRLPSDLDKARGSSVEYFLANGNRGLDHGATQGAVRYIRIPEGGELSDLPSYRLCKQSLDEEAGTKLRVALAKHGTDGVCEVSGLSRVVGSDADILFELIRVLLHEAWNHDANVMWIITFADKAFQSMQKTFGKRAIPQSGAPVSIDPGSKHTQSPPHLIPSVVDTRRLPELMMEEIEMTLDAKHSFRLERTLRFLSEGLHNDLAIQINRYLSSRIEVAS